jgi:c(7)-type cytochrome triheme protein
MAGAGSGDGSSRRAGWPPLAAALAATVVATLAVVGVVVAQEDTRVWAPLEKDGLHDPASPAIPLLQQPRQALSRLPPDSAGNLVRWVEAVDNNIIIPRSNILPETKVRLRDDYIIMNPNGSMPPVRFPHRAHTLWLDCENCHEYPFKSKTGTNNISMLRILEGEQCGLCHGAVAFPLTECARCHSVQRQLRPVGSSGAAVPLPAPAAPASAPLK